MKLLFKILKSLFVEPTREDAKIVSKEVFRIDNFDTLFEVSTILDEKVGDTESCPSKGEMAYVIASNRDEDESFQRHLENCPVCKKYYLQIKDYNIPGNVDEVDYTELEKKLS